MRLPDHVDFRFTVDFRRPSPDSPGGFVVAYSTFKALPGETWERGNDMGDGAWSAETLTEIARRLLEMAVDEGVPNPIIPPTDPRGVH